MGQVKLRAHVRRCWARCGTMPVTPELRKQRQEDGCKKLKIRIKTEVKVRRTEDGLKSDWERRWVLKSVFQSQTQKRKKKLSITSYTLYLCME